MLDEAEFTVRPGDHIRIGDEVIQVITVSELEARRARTRDKG